LASAREINSIPKADIPRLLGEIEIIKVRLLVRLMEFKEQQIIALTRAAAEQAAKAENSSKATQHEPHVGPQGRLMRLKEVVRMVGLSRATIYAYAREANSQSLGILGQDRLRGWTQRSMNGLRKDHEKRQDEG
jgi:hypothetical protein